MPITLKMIIIRAEEKIILVFAFGGVGSLMRFGVSSYTKTIVGTTFPLGTLIVNCLGSFLFGLIWSFLQSLNLNDRWDDKVFLVLFIVSNLVLFGGVYWSKFAHMFYKPGAAIQKNLAEADGSRDNLPPPADVPEQFGPGIKREEPKHY